MISVLDHIEFLISMHNCVIVPGLGALISQYSVRRDTNGNIIGLRREITFNPSVVHNDGLLANSISRKERISFESANNEISKYVSCLHSQLTHEGEVPMGRVGYFSCTTENKLEFFPFPTSNTKNEFYGLSSIKLKPLLSYTENIVQDKNLPNSNVITISKRVFRVAASIVLLIGMVLVLSTPILNTNNQDYANLNAFSLKTHDEIENTELCIAIPSINNNNEFNENNTIESETNLRDRNGNYCIVIASLSTESQISKLVQEKGLTQYDVFESSSKYRVYIAKGTYDEMISLKESKYAGSDAWVCRIK
ncbi:MAG: hypothetical protein E7080_02065 [Bacteroidales bacterium]|nr:hypothetical protein [Bacteroidales bacterium]